LRSSLRDWRFSGPFQNSQAAGETLAITASRADLDGQVTAIRQLDNSDIIPAAVKQFKVQLQPNFD